MRAKHICTKVLNIVYKGNAFIPLAGNKCCSIYLAISYYLRGDPSTPRGKESFKCVITCFYKGSSFSKSPKKKRKCCFKPSIVKIEFVKS